MSLQNSTGNEYSIEPTPGHLRARRKNSRYVLKEKISWDFYSSKLGTKTGYLEDISKSGCLIRTIEKIEHRRWIRIVIKSTRQNIWFSAVGRIMRREDRLECQDQDDFTLHRYGIEFIQPVNPLVSILSRFDYKTACVSCGKPILTDGDSSYCLLCHLRKACYNLLAHEA